MAGSLATLETPVGEPTAELPPEAPPAPAVAPGRRRFVRSVGWGAAVVTPFYLWVLWDLWSNHPTVLRGEVPDNFYELQARAMLHGHLYVPNGSLGIEAFVHGGRQYTYFGILPSLLRMPVVVFTHRWDGYLTAPSLLLAWIATGVGSALLLWRVRVLMRGDATLGRGEAFSFGVVMATILGGSVVLVLAADPYVYSEDFAWSVPLTVLSLYALLGVLEAPSARRVVVAGTFILLTNLDRSTTGYATVIGALLVAGWFALGRGGADRRRWAGPVALAGLVPLAVNCAITYAKFGLPFGLPMADQVWASVNAHRREFLAANGGKAFSFGFLPSTGTAYFTPFGLRFTGVFPFIAMPATPAPALDGAVLDQTYATGSFPTQMPLLFLLGVWGAVAAFRPRPPGRTALTRLPLLAAAACAGGVLLWGYIADRYMSDLMPFFILAAGVGLIDLWRRLEGRSRAARWWTAAGTAALGVFCVCTNVAIAAAPTLQWSPAQTRNFVDFQERVTPGALAATTSHGTVLPHYAPAGAVFVMDNCSGVYESTGDRFNDVPGQQIEHATWLPVEQGPDIVHDIDVQFNQLATHLHHPITLLTYGSASVVLTPIGHNRIRVSTNDLGAPSVAWPTATSWTFPVIDHGVYRFGVTTDPNLDSIVVSWFGEEMVGHYLAGPGPAVVHTTPAPAAGHPPPAVTVTDTTPASQREVPLCRELLGRG